MATRNNNLDLALAVLETVPSPPDGWTLQDIADLAGTHRTAIAWWEQKAIRKLRSELRRRESENAIRNLTQQPNAI